MRIAQASHMKLKKIHSENRRLEFPHLPSQPGLDPTVIGLEAMTQKVEHVLIIYRMKSFELRENNSQKYNRKALQEYITISKIYDNFIEQIRFDNTLRDREVKHQQIKVYSKLFK